MSLAANLGGEDMAGPLMTVETYRFLPEAEAVRMYLAAEGVTALLADAEAVGMDFLGSVKLQVPAAQAGTAGALLDRLRQKQQERREGDEDVEGEACLACGAALAEEAPTCPDCGRSYAGGEAPEGQAGQQHPAAQTDPDDTGLEHVLRLREALAAVEAQIQRAGAENDVESSACRRRRASPPSSPTSRRF
jgi:hypothetical protein